MRLLLRRWAINRGDFVVGLILFVAGNVLIAVATIVWGQVIESHKEVAGALIAIWGGLLLASIGGVVKITSTRQKLIRLFASEIKALQFGLSNIEMFESWRLLYCKPEKGEIGFAAGPRRENYFQYFDALGDNIGNMHPSTVDAIVRFYTYLKMSRDAAASLLNWEMEKDVMVRKKDVADVVNLLALSMVWGFVALWSMGFTATPQEYEFLEKIEASYGAVVRKELFDVLRQDDVPLAELEQFFHLYLPTFQSLARQILVHLVKSTSVCDQQLLLARRKEVSAFRDDMLDRISPSMPGRIDIDALWQRAIRQAAADLAVHKQEVASSLPERSPLQIQDILRNDFDFIATAEAVRKQIRA
jgi:hypothetical protein